MLDLQSRQQCSLGPTRLAYWIAERALIAYLPGGNELERVDSETAARSFHGGANFNPVVRPVETGGFRLEPIGQHTYSSWRLAYRVVDLAERLAPLEFEAYRAVLASDSVLALATTPTSRAAQLTGTPGPQNESIDANIFIVEPSTGAATFIASASVTPRNWPFATSGECVAWTDRYCPSEGARTSAYDQRTGHIVQFGRGMWLVLTPRGELGMGEFGPQALFDLATLRYKFVLPAGPVDVAWSPDYRYGARGFTGGHGGLCP